MDDELSTTQVARQHQVHPTTVLRWIAAGDLDAHWVGKRLRVKKSDSDAIRQPVSATAEPAPAP
ncbi:helix-turn-helix domain-containing protein [Kineosporia babensis]|uniref:Helix-turn-helix domain-containing protein n=1 Tax=Kineosporia babensis TaxID=499548 RepID=A0A9X1SYB1_9ACTN|nr:helix-turn-helix domain-containing protein [Kineosporia babensis]